MEIPLPLAWELEVQLENRGATKMESSEIFESHIGPVIEKYPKLSRVLTSEGKVTLKGEMEIIDAEGNFWEVFEIEIHHVDSYPLQFPKVYEVGGKIPKIADWHIYVDTKSCCVAIAPEESIACKKGITLVQFIDEFVLPFFFNQAFRRVEGYYKNGEYSHGIQGIFEFYDETFKTHGNVSALIRLMKKMALIKTRPGRTHQCFCGSVNKFRHCHRETFNKLFDLDRRLIQVHADLIVEAWN
ncbi:hypothetical protein LZF95_23405 [Algoriphagus sp. AGSA1]|uniref:hypothetical protein n=1 Tax=Algoriphagus sp. AGSA1 TaxID=2907213 RepID=UPI001F3C3715|nr:hypothetical protein [Algoriphagus sp. AGSA1]MCE7057649.1 hypothetical protein [Algoriphagus sp. AGSA1]